MFWKTLFVRVMVFAICFGDFPITVLFMFWTRVELLSSSWWTTTQHLECVCCGCVSSRQLPFPGSLGLISSLTVLIRWWVSVLTGSGTSVGFSLLLQRWWLVISYIFYQNNIDMVIYHTFQLLVYSLKIFHGTI